MKETLNRLKKVVSDCAVTLVLRTHRTHPENAQDSIKLKNKVSEARQRLENEYDAEIAKNLGDKLEKLADKLDVNYNLEGLVLFVDADHAEFVRLPVELNDRIIIDSTFATRPLFRALNLETRYYLLKLSKDKARLLRDRKSTRVNSSHVAISYAVFSSKKNKESITLVLSLIILIRLTV